MLNECTLVKILNVIYLCNRYKITENDKIKCTISNIRFRVCTYKKKNIYIYIYCQIKFDPTHTVLLHVTEFLR